MYGGGKEGGGGGGESGGGGGRGDCSTRLGRDGGIEGDGYREGVDELGECGGPVKCDFHGGASGIIIHVEGSGTDPQGGRGLMQHRPRVDGVEGSGSDS